ncbi:hypothetical protein V12B01_12925 [Vibrio splendidus 12B01]|nr:hypothetical protein V12B01_12925 [Vibrio splendidus 12B01]
MTTVSCSNLSFVTSSNNTALR